VASPVKWRVRETRQGLRTLDASPQGKTTGSDRGQVNRFWGRRAITPERVGKNCPRAVGGGGNRRGGVTCFTCERLIWHFYTDERIVSPVFR